VVERLAGRRCNVSDIFTEVDEEVRREQLKKLWDRYRNLIVGAAFLVVAGVGGWRAYEYRQAVLAAESGAAYDAAARLAADGKAAEAQAAFAKTAADGTPGYRLLSQLREAAVAAQQDPKAAVDLYDRIAAQNSRQPLMGELASLRAAFLLVDSAKLDEMTRRLEPLAQPNGTFRHTARELLAFSAWNNHDTAAARKWADAAKDDPESPPALRNRMDALTDLLPPASKT
jgi:hypothetical protein